MATTQERFDMLDTALDLLIGAQDAHTPGCCDEYDPDHVNELEKHIRVASELLKEEQDRLAAMRRHPAGKGLKVA